jgi:hypothetical protein
MFQKERSSFLAAILIGLTAFLCWTGVAAAAESGQRTFAKIVVEPAVDDTTGGTIYLLTSEKSPLPANSNESANASLYLPMYPLSSTVSAFDLNCQPTNCDHVNVLPFHFSGYDPLPGSSPACTHFNGGQECALVKGHDHLVAAAPTGGDFNVARQLKLVVFTSKAFGDGAIHNRVKTESQIKALVASGDAMIVDTPVIVHGAITSERTYELGTPVVIPFP